MTDCAICHRLKHIASDPALVHEFAHSYLLLGNHQYFAGYCILLYKKHVRELHELDAETQAALNQELMISTRAVVKAFDPWKMNHASLANRDQHIHWHIIPRYESEADRTCDPWKYAAEFDQWQVPDKQKTELAAKLKHHILQDIERMKA